MKILKTIGTGLAIASLATASYAGTLTEPDVITVDEAEQGSSASSNGSGFLLPLLALIAIAVVISSDDDSGNTAPE